jgi:outer membrane protein assembly factor BamB
MLKNFRRFALFCSFVFAITPAFAADWPNWRGPNHNGATEADNLPVEFSATENVAWSADMPGVSSATPVIANGRVYVATNDDTRAKLSGLCFDAATGELLWEKVLVNDAEPNARNDMASCSPVTDGERVYFTFGNGQLFALDKDGNEIFKKNLEEEYGPVRSNWGYSSSPLLLDGVLYIQNLTGQYWTDMGMRNHTDEASYIVAISAEDGETLWKVHRPTDAKAESFDAYTTPVPYEFNGETVIAVMGGDYITGHDLETGEERFRHFHNPRQGEFDRLIPSPVVAGKFIVGLQPRGVDAFAFDPADGKELKYEQSSWIYAAKTADVPTPSYYDGKLFIINGARKELLCLDAKTGAEIYYEDLGADTRIWSSPTIADGKVYALTETGQVVIAAASENFEVLNRIDLGSSEPSKASIAIANDRLYIRTADKLYCVGR